MPICFQVVPEPAARSRKAKAEDLGVREHVGLAVLGDLGLHEHADEVVLRVLAPGREDRVHDLHERVDALVLAVTTARMSRACSTEIAEAPADREQRDRRAELHVEVGATVRPRSCRSARCTVVPIQFSIHQRARLGTNDGWTSARYRRCRSPSIVSMLES